MSDLLDLTGHVAMVTGSGQGVGRQIALDYAANGALVVINDYVEARAKAVAEEIAEAGGTAVPVQGDVTDLAQMKEIVARVATDHGPIDILVSNAGNGGANPNADMVKPFWETGPEAWNGFIGVNLYGVINGVSAVIPGMIEKKYGRIITIVSEASRYGDVGLEIYSGAKAGAAGFTRAVARRMGRYNVTANNIAIAATVTPQTEARFTPDTDRNKKIMEKYVVRRFGKPSDVANLAQFLASEGSEYITGQTYAVNGGFLFGL